MYFCFYISFFVLLDHNIFLDRDKIWTTHCISKKLFPSFNEYNNTWDMQLGWKIYLAYKKLADVKVS